MPTLALSRVLRAVAVAGTLIAAGAASAVDLTVTHFGTGLYGVPFAVAREKGWFASEAKIDVTGFITSAGGGTTVRNALASDIPYGEVALPAAIAAIQQGVPLTIVHGGVLSVADMVWATRRDDESISRPADLKGKKLGYSSPKSVTDILTSMMIDANGLGGQLERKSVGGVGAGLTALREGGVDMVYVTEPVWSKEKGNYRAAWRSTDIVPRITQTVGIVRTDYLKKNPEQIKGIIAARRKGVEFVRAHPAEVAPIMAREYKIPEDQAKAAIESVLGGKGTYWSAGEFDYEGMEVMLKGLRLVKAIPEGAFDWNSVIDESYLPEDLRRKQ
ncbi:MAG: ABC transporter substrate-binding protein [Burkholderiaceae bacterium]|jgi:NitT/TauT family transport system substrate-binding protein|nr:ABC transporter substrate-binding protein [Burkholderiaceae bacterium]